MKESAIGWCDFSGGDLNFVTGCTPVSEGCQNCYARAIYQRFGRDFDTVTVHPEKLERLARMGHPVWSPKRGGLYNPMYFVCDTGDLFHPDVPDEFLYRAFDVMRWRQTMIFQVLTKRPERMRDFVGEYKEDRGWLVGSGLNNIWLGVTAENQQRADERIPILLDTPAAVRFVSVEPMLGPVDLAPYLYHNFVAGPMLDPIPGTIGGKPMPAARLGARLDWVICGAESGPNRRPFDVAWAADLHEQCKGAGVPFFGKQDGGLKPGEPLYIRPSASSEIAGVIHEWPR